MADLTPNARNPQAEEIRAAIRVLDRRAPYTAEVDATATLLGGIIRRHRPANQDATYDARCVCGDEYPCLDVHDAMALAAAIVGGDTSPQVPLHAATRARAAQKGDPRG